MKALIRNAVLVSLISVPVAGFGEKPVEGGVGLLPGGNLNAGFNQGQQPQRVQGPGNVQPPQNMKKGQNLPAQQPQQFPPQAGVPGGQVLGIVVPPPADPLEGVSPSVREKIREASKAYNDLFADKKFGQPDMYEFAKLADATAQCFKRDRETSGPARKYSLERESIVASPEVVAKGEPPKKVGERVDFFLRLLNDDKYKVREWAQGELGRLGLRAKTRLVGMLIGWYDREARFKERGKPKQVPPDFSKYPGGVKITSRVVDGQLEQAAEDVKTGVRFILRGLFPNVAVPPPPEPIQRLIDPVFGDVTGRTSLALILQGGRFGNTWLRDYLPGMVDKSGIRDSIEADLKTLVGAARSWGGDVMGLSDLEGRTRAISFLLSETAPEELLAGCLNTAAEGFAQGFHNGMFPGRTVHYCAAVPAYGGYFSGYGGGYGVAGGWQQAHFFRGGGLHGKFSGYAPPPPVPLGQSTNAIAGNMPRSGPNAPMRMDIEKSLQNVFEGAVNCSKQMASKLGESPPFMDADLADSGQYSECMRRALVGYLEPLHAAAFPDKPMPICDRQPQRNYRFRYEDVSPYTAGPGIGPGVGIGIPAAAGGGIPGGVGGPGMGHAPGVGGPAMGLVPGNFNF